MILPIYAYGMPVLRKKAEDITPEYEGLNTLLENMFETMYAAPGIGLAAIQVGVPKRLLVIDLQEDEGAGDEPVRNPRVFVNPEILDPSDEHSLYNEGCLSVPDQYAEVERPAQIRARWQDLDGKVHEETMTGLMATCLQHEMDHLLGKVFVEYLSALKRDRIRTKMIKKTREEMRDA